MHHSTGKIKSFFQIKHFHIFVQAIFRYFPRFRQIFGVPGRRIVYFAVKFFP